jgi:hypothetical protein
MAAIAALKAASTSSKTASKVQTDIAAPRVEAAISMTGIDAPASIQR